MRKVISLTTIPPRLPSLKKTLESLDRQSVDVVYLNIPDVCIKTNSRYEFPEWLTQSRWQRLSIHYCKTDYGPATKIIPTLALEQDASTQILICDDDHWYEDNWSNQYFDHFSEGSFVCGNGVNSVCVEHDLINEYELTPGSASKLRSLFEGKHYDFSEAFSGLLIERSSLDPQRLIELAALSKECFYADDLVFSKLLAEHNLTMTMLGLENVKMHSMNDYGVPEWSLCAGITGGNKFNYMSALPSLLGIDLDVAYIIKSSQAI
jgi:hypothetical protein